MRIYFLLLFILVSCVIGDELVDSVLTIERALEIAAENNPQINQIREQIDSKKAEWWSGFGITKSCSHIG